MNPILSRSLSRCLALTLVLLGLVGCGAMTAQNPSGTLRPVNAVADGPDSAVMLKGADVVAYFTQNQYTQGLPSLQSHYQGVTFRFASAEHKTLFDKDPTKYLPQYGGYCANGVAYGIPWGGDADTWKMINGKLYIFGGAASRDAWLLDEPTNLQRAEHYWREEIAGHNSFWQRTKRLVFRVPHYQSGEQLAKAVADAKARKP